MMHVGDIMNTVGVFSTGGGYHPLYFEYLAGVKYWGISSFVL